VFDIKLVFHEIVVPVVIPTIINIEDKLLTEPKTTYELELGKEKELDLGKYQADSAIVFTSYAVSSTSQGSSEDITDNLADVFLVQAQHKNQKISLKIDLTKLNPLFNGMTVSGNLNMIAMNRDKKSYSIGFKLVCSSSYCDKKEEETTETDSTETSDAESKKATEDTAKAELEDVDEEGFDDEEDFEDDFEDEEYDEDEDYQEDYSEEEDYGDYD
jgi:hypothetical protein